MQQNTADGKRSLTGARSDVDDRPWMSVYKASRKLGVLVQLRTDRVFDQIVVSFRSQRVDLALELRIEGLRSSGVLGLLSRHLRDALPDLLVGFGEHLIEALHSLIADPLLSEVKRKLAEVGHFSANLLI